VALSLCASPAFAARHNFVNLDLTWQTPVTPQPHHLPWAASLVDADSAVRTGDRINFDMLELQRSLLERDGRGISGGHMQWRIDHYQVSCGWRTIRKLPNRPADFDVTVAGRPAYADPFNQQENFLNPDSAFASFTDKLCAGLPLAAARGAPGVEAAVAAWKDNLQPGGVVNVIALGSKPGIPEWMPGKTYRFEPIQTEAATGDRLFLDHANLTRDSETVTGFELAILGPEAQRHSWQMIEMVALRRVRYDCAGRSLTVLAQGYWDRFGTFFEKSEIASVPRGAQQSPTIAADIAAACERNPQVPAQSFPSVMEAWAFARTQWPAATEPAWAACVWNHFPGDERAHLLEHPPSNFKFLTKDELAALKTCGDADMSPWRSGFLFSAYAEQRAMLPTLTQDTVNETRIQSLWQEIPWLDRQRYVRGVKTYGSNDPQFQNNLVAALLDKLGVPRSHDSTRQALSRYLQAEATLETN
jgi:hypothetical protein